MRLFPVGAHIFAMSLYDSDVSEPFQDSGREYQASGSESETSNYYDAPLHLTEANFKNFMLLDIKYVSKSDIPLYITLKSDSVAQNANNNSDTDCSENDSE